MQAGCAAALIFLSTGSVCRKGFLIRSYQKRCCRAAPVSSRFAVRVWERRLNASPGDFSPLFFAEKGLAEGMTRYQIRSRLTAKRSVRIPSVTACAVTAGRVRNARPTWGAGICAPSSPCAQGEPLVRCIPGKLLQNSFCLPVSPSVTACAVTAAGLQRNVARHTVGCYAGIRFAGTKASL